MKIASEVLKFGWETILNTFVTPTPTPMPAVAVIPKVPEAGFSAAAAAAAAVAAPPPPVAAPVPLPPATVAMQIAFQAPCEITAGPVTLCLLFCPREIEAPLVNDCFQECREHAEWDLNLRLRCDPNPLDDSMITVIGRQSRALILYNQRPFLPYGYTIFDGGFSTFFSYEDTFLLRDVVLRSHPNETKPKNLCWVYEQNTYCNVLPGSVYHLNLNFCGKAAKEDMARKIREGYGVRIFISQQSPGRHPDIYTLSPVAVHWLNGVEPGPDANEKLMAEKYLAEAEIAEKHRAAEETASEEGVSDLEERSDEEDITNMPPLVPVATPAAAVALPRVVAASVSLLPPPTVAMQICFQASWKTSSHPIRFCLMFCPRAIDDPKMDMLLNKCTANAEWGIDLRLRCNSTVGSSRVDLQACKLEYSIVSPK